MRPFLGQIAPDSLKMLVKGPLTGCGYWFVPWGVVGATLKTYHVQKSVNHSRLKVRTLAERSKMVGVNDRRSPCGLQDKLGMFVLPKGGKVGLIRM